MIKIYSPDGMNAHTNQDGSLNYVTSKVGFEY